MIQISQAKITQVDKTSRLRKYMHKQLVALKGGQALPDGEEQIRGGIAIGLAEAYFLEGNVPSAIQTYIETIELGKKQEKMIAVIGLMRLAQLHDLSGHLHQAGW